QQVQKGAWQPVRHVNRDAPAGLAAVCEKAMVLRSENRYGSALEMAAVETSLGRMADLRGQERWAQAREVLEQADRRLGANGPADLRHQVDQSRHDLELVSRLDEIHLESASLVDGHFDEKGADRAYAEEFARSGLAREEEAAATVAARIQQSSIAPQLVAALDDWANITGDDLRRAWLLETARKADPDEWRNQFRQPQVWQDRTALEQLAKKVDVVKQSPQLLSALGIGLRATNGDAIRLLTAAQHQYPGDFWLNVNLALALQKSDPREATSYYRVALAIRPETAIVYYNLGTALHGQKKLDEAVAAFRKAIDLKPDLAKSYNELGIALHNQEKLGEAVAAYKKAIDIKPDFVVVYNNLGLVLRDQKKLEEAVTAYRKAIDLKPDFAMAYDNLGLVLCDQNKLDEAVTAYGKAIDIKPDYADAYYNLGLVLQHQRKGEEAVIAYRKAIATKPDYADAYYNLGFVLQHQRKLEEVAIAYRKAIGIKPDYAEASCNLGHALRDAGKFHEALSYLKRGHQLGQKTVGWSYPSELWIKKCEQLIELDDKLVPILKGEQRPKNAEEQLALADLCMRFKNAYVSAAQFFTNAFKEAPTLADALMNGNRYNAACAAALASTGQGKEDPKPDERQRARLRKQALDWLRADLAAWSKQLDDDRPMLRPTLLQIVGHWKEDEDLAAIRDKGFLAKLPESEREAFRKLWADVDQLLKKANEEKK
ncbi:MAG TPA: tetratricopeptide repeat protein, partial [Gemmataceae bacterium]|nr:tetratricopeptide repeat protein [Gemmataceae bacterium]